MAIVAEDYFGGALGVLLVSGDITLGWSSRLRVIRVRPDVSGHTITLKAANSQEIPYTRTTWIILNEPLIAQTIDVTDNEATFTATIDANKACIIVRYTNSSGQPRFAIDKRDILT